MLAATGLIALSGGAIKSAVKMYKDIAEVCSEKGRKQYSGDAIEREAHKIALYVTLLKYQDIKLASNRSKLTGDYLAKIISTLRYDEAAMYAFRSSPNQSIASILVKDVGLRAKFERLH